MLKSMTGYGQGKAVNPYGRIVVEVQTVNRKHFEVNINLPKDLIQIENDLRKDVSESISRGKISVYVGFDRAGEKSKAVKIDFGLAKKYFDAYKKLKYRFGIKGEIDLPCLIESKNVVIYEETRIDPAVVIKDITKALKSALAALNKMRSAEGRVLEEDVKKRLKIIKDNLAFIEKIMPKTVLDFEVRLKARIKDFEGDKGGDERISKEVAIFADRIDVSEEILRLKSHIKQFIEVLKKKEPVGKLIDFIIQEMVRESNTIGSKANNVEISKKVINIKSELEKIREQIQNVE